MLQRVIIVVVALGFVVLTLVNDAKGQAVVKPKPDLSGVWKLEKLIWSYGPYRPSTPTPDFIMVISHIEPEVKVKSKLAVNGREIIEDLTYYSDERGEVGRTIVDSAEGSSKTKWRGDKLVSRFRVNPKKIDGEVIGLDVVQEFKLSDDGKTLIQIQKTSRVDNAFAGDMNSRNRPPNSTPENFYRPLAGTITRVFARQP